VCIRRDKFFSLALVSRNISNATSNGTSLLKVDCLRQRTVNGFGSASSLDELSTS
jgi:hypothetical protein